MRRSTLIRQLCASLLFPACFAYSQTSAPDKPQPAPPTTFDVVSIRPYVSNGTFQKATISPGYFFSQADRAGNLIAMAYGISEFQFVDAPSWVHFDPYTIVAKMDNPSEQDRIPLYLKPPSPNSPQSLALQVFQQRLQALLTDRFHLKVHMDKKDMSHYDLVVAKGGLKLPEADSDSCNPDLPDKTVNRGGISFRCGPMAQLALTLFFYVGKPVEDKTGLTGLYNVSLEAPLGRDASVEDSGISIYQNLQQLGLKLQPSQGPVDVLVIDHIDKPSPN
jgi:uncharacterized protein (TIGR03435 family)